MAVVVSEKDVNVSKVSWRGIWAGLFMIAGVQILMQLFGVAIGVSALSPTENALRGVSLWQGVWAMVSTLSAYFFGGWVASAMMAPARRADGLLSGVVLWALATTLGIVLVASGLFGAIGMGRSLLMPQGGGLSGAGLAALHSGYTMLAAWATFATILLSLGAAIGGGLIGCVGDRLPREYIQRKAPVGPPVPIT
jgi:hypothetical protein